MQSAHSDFTSLSIQVVVEDVEEVVMDWMVMWSGGSEIYKGRGILIILIFIFICLTSTSSIYQTPTPPNNQPNKQTLYHDGPPIPYRSTSIPQPSCFFFFIIIIIIFIVEDEHLISNYQPISLCYSRQHPNQTMRYLPIHRFIHTYLWKRITPFIPIVSR
jgi:hypothetical protein